MDRRIPIRTHQSRTDRLRTRRLRTDRVRGVGLVNAPEIAEKRPSNLGTSGLEVDTVEDKICDPGVLNRMLLVCVYSLDPPLKADLGVNVRP